MSFGFAGAAAGSGDALQQMLAERRAAFLQQEQLKLQQAAGARADQGQQQQADQFQQSMAFNQQREAADQAERQRQAARQAAGDAAAASERQTAQNQRQDQQGVRRMIALTMRNQDPASQQQAGEMAFTEGVELPPDPNAELREYEARKKIDLRYRPPAGPAAPARQEWVIRGGQPTPIPAGTAQPGDTPYDAVASRQKDSSEPSPYAAERAFRTQQSIDELIGKVSGSTVGFGSVLDWIPATDARNFHAELETLKANIAFNELTAMREASKTGGALGNVSNVELGLLTSTLGALDTRQSPANFKAQLEKIKGSLARWNAAQAEQGLAGGIQDPRAPAAAPTGGGPRFTIIGTR